MTKPDSTLALIATPEADVTVVELFAEWVCANGMNKTPMAGT